MELEYDDIIHFLDLIDSMYSPNFTPEIGRRRPYWKLFKEENRNSTEYKRFIKVYSYVKEDLNEREIFVLDYFYGVSGKFLLGSDVAKMLNISSSRVTQIRRYAERKMGRKLYSYMVNRVI